MTDGVGGAYVTTGSGSSASAICDGTAADSGAAFTAGTYVITGRGSSARSIDPREATTSKAQTEVLNHAIFKEFRKFGCRDPYMKFCHKL
jgi:hypothetical protein